LIKHETRDQLRVALPLNHIDFDTVPDEAYKSGLYDERVLLVLTSEELMRETDGSGSITVDDIFGLYESALRAQMVN
jgi:hypothetical protein